jgi:hypothetical protein
MSNYVTIPSSLFLKSLLRLALVSRATGDTKEERGGTFTNTRSPNAHYPDKKWQKQGALAGLSTGKAGA